MSTSNIKDTNHRFSDVEGEPCIMLTPIEGFDRQNLVTLEEATEPLTNIVPRIATYVHVAKERAKNPANNLSVDQSASIALYTMEWEPFNQSVYYILNHTLRTENRQQLKPWFLYLKLILTGLSHLPSYSSTVYRGVKSDIEHGNERYKIGESIIWWGFSSCSQNRNISEKNQFLGDTGQRTLFVIKCIKGKDIGKHSYYRTEKEILLLPATKVKIISNTCREDGLRTIELQEVESPFILLEQLSSKSTSQTFNPRTLPKMPTIEMDRYCNTKLSEYIVRSKHHSEAFLNGQRYNENDMKIIVQELILAKQCRELFLRESGITSQSACIIAGALRNNKTLEGLFISHNLIGDDGVKDIAEALSGNNNTTLKQLSLGYNNITDNGMEYLANMLETNRTLTHLLLPKTDIGDRGLKRLAEVLTHANKTLQNLSLEWNKFREDSSIDILANMLKVNQSLISLNLNSCKLSKISSKKLKAVAKTKKKFELSI